MTHPNRHNIREIKYGNILFINRQQIIHWIRKKNKQKKERKYTMIFFKKNVNKI